MRDLNYRHLGYFRAVAREGNLTRTAERLNLSQSALSSQIRTLEERIGHALFERQGRGLVLTEAGRIALDHADAIFAIGDDLAATLAERAVEGPPRIRVGALATLSRNFQVDFLRPLLAVEGARIAVRSGRMPDLLAAMDRHELDVVLANERPPAEGAERHMARRIAEQPISLVAAPGRIATGDRPEILLAREPVVAPTPATSIRMDFDAWCTERAIAPRIVAEIDDMAMLRALARTDIGVCVVPPIVVKDELREGELIEAGHLDGLTESFYAITLNRRFPNAVLAKLLGG